jgi:hypothetical protein
MQQAKRKNSYLGLIVIVFTLAVLMFILVTIIGILFFTSRTSASSAGQANLFTGSSPLRQLTTEKIDPALALASLGGVPDPEVISEAIDKARPETALAGLLFQPALNNKESAGSFLQLAQAYIRQNEPAKATLSYQLASTIATLAPDLSDTVRADVFLQAGEGLLQLKEVTLAKFYLDQAFTIAAKSPYLQAAHRRSIFERLQKSYIILNERALAKQSLNLGANPPNLTLIAEEQRLLPQPQPVPLPASAQAAEAARWQAAQELAIKLLESEGSASQTAVRALAEALVREDQEKSTYFAGEINTASQLSRRTDFIFAQIAWLSIKYRVARRGYGLSLVPQWEAEAEQIRADLTKSYENLFALYADVVVALPEASQLDQATEEKLRYEILAGELGRYPNYPKEQRQKQLSDITNQLISTQPEANLFVGTSTVKNEQMFTLISVK